MFWFKLLGSFPWGRHRSELHTAPYFNTYLKWGRVPGFSLAREVPSSTSDEGKRLSDAGQGRRDRGKSRKAPGTVRGVLWLQVPDRPDPSAGASAPPAPAVWAPGPVFWPVFSHCHLSVIRRTEIFMPISQRCCDNWKVHFWSNIQHSQWGGKQGVLWKISSSNDLTNFYLGWFGRKDSPQAYRFFSKRLSWPVVCFIPVRPG